MPTLRRLCSHPGCSSDAIRNRQFCAPHAATRDQAHRQQKDKGRPSASARGYDVKWRRIRAMFLRHNPVCLHCSRPAEEVDHIIPLAQNGTNKWDNLQPLCKSCHSKKTGRDKRAKSVNTQAKSAKNARKSTGGGGIQSLAPERSGPTGAVKFLRRQVFV